MVGAVASDGEQAIIRLFGLEFTPASFWILAIVSLLLLGVAGYFFYLLVSGYRLANQRIRLLEVAAGKLVAGNPLETRQEALETAKSADDSTRSVETLWREFDHSLVESPNGEELNSTEPAEQFFNSETLAGELLHGRVLSFLPTSLTAVGVLGTFFGLVVGLSGLELGAGTDSDVLRKGVSDLISGAGMAFVTSLLGVFLSLGASFAHNRSAARINQRIRALQESIDETFHRRAADYSLVLINQDSHAANLALQELHEKLGDKFQQAVDGISSEMQAAVTAALERSIAPVMGELSTVASQQSTEIMERLIGNFALSFESLGERQATNIDSASMRLNESMGQLSTGMNDLMSEVSEKISATVEGSSQQTDRLVAQVESLATSLATQQHHTDQVVDRLATVVLDAGNAMTDSSRHLTTATSGLERTSASLTTAAESLGEHLEATSQTLASTRTELAKAASSLDAITGRIGEQQDQTDSLRESMTTTATSLQQTTATAQEAFKEVRMSQGQLVSEVKEQFTALGDQLQKQISDIRGAMQEWLDAYAENVSSQTTQRMNEWNSHSQDYAESMLRVAQELSEVVDEFDDRKQRSNGAAARV